MKKSTIWTIAVVMGLAFAGLLLLQLSYIEEMAKMKKEQFDESVNHALDQAAHNLEMNETLRYLEKDVQQTERKAYKQDSMLVDGLDGTIKQSHQFAVAADDGTVYSSFELKTFAIHPASVPKAVIMRTDNGSLAEATKSFQEIVRNRYVYQKALLDEVVYNILYTASDKPLKERVNFKSLDLDIHAELIKNGISIPYHFTVSTADGREVYRCPEYSDEGEQFSYSKTLFLNDPPSKRGVVRIHFPAMNTYIFSSVRFMIPAVVFTIVLIITFIFTIVIIFRQKRYTEIEEIHRDQERLHQQHDARAEDSHQQHLAGGSDAERRLGRQESADAEAPWGRHQRRIETSALPRREGVADVDVRPQDSFV